MSFADSVAVMQEGKILQVGTPDELYRSPASAAVAQLIGDGQLLSCTIRDGEMHSILGSFSCDRPEGPGLVLLRPEDLVMSGSRRMSRMVAPDPTAPWSAVASSVMTFWKTC